MLSSSEYLWVCHTMHTLSCIYANSLSINHILWLKTEQYLLTTAKQLFQYPSQLKILFFCRCLWHSKFVILLNGNSAPLDGKQRAKWSHPGRYKPGLGQINKAAGAEHKSIGWNRSEASGDGESHVCSLSNCVSVATGLFFAAVEAVKFWNVPDTIKKRFWEHYKCC